MEGEGVYLYCRQTPRSDGDVLCSLLGSCHAIHLYMPSMLLLLGRCLFSQETITWLLLLADKLHDKLINFHVK